VVGNVVNQREISFEQSLTLTTAIKQAGGIRSNKKDNQVTVLSGMGSSSGTRREILVDLKAIERKQAPDLELQDLDVVEVTLRKSDKIHKPFVNPCPWVPTFNKL